MEITVAVERYLSFATNYGYSPLTIKKYQFFFARLTNWITGEVEIVTYATLKGFIASLDTGQKAKTRAGYIGVLRGFGDFLQREEGIVFAEGMNPFLRLRPPRLPSRVPDAPEPSELVKVMQTGVYLRTPGQYNARAKWMNQRNGLLLCTLVSTGLRNGEARALCWKDVRLAGAHLRIIGKGDKERLVPLPEALAALYGAYWQIECDQGRGRAADPVFFGKAGPLGEQAVRDIVKDVLGSRLENFSHITPHMLRHAAATALVEAGVDLATVASLLGHSNVQTTYAHYLKPRERKKAEAIALSPLSNLALNVKI